MPAEEPESFGLSSKGPDKAPQIRHTRPEVAKHCALARSESVNVGAAEQ